MSSTLDPDTGLPYPKIQVFVASQVPYLVKQAATQAGYEHGTLWVRHIIAQALAQELGEDYEELMADMPPSWRQRPGFIRSASE